MSLGTATIVDPTAPPAGSAQITSAIAAAAAEYGVPASLALAVAQAESSLNQNAISSAGAIGIFQLMPATAAMLGVDPTNWQQNIQGGVKYLAMLLAQFTDPVQAVAAYNWGPSAVSSAVSNYGPDWLGAAPGETQNYVQEILGVSPAQEAANYDQMASPLEPVPSPDVEPVAESDTDEDVATITESVSPWLVYAGIALAGLTVFFVARSA